MRCAMPLCSGRFRAACAVGGWRGSLRGIGVDGRSELSGAARRQVTFLVLPRKVTKRNRPRFAAATRYPTLLDWSGGCGTRATRSNITSDLAGVVCQLSRMASCFISPRRHPLTSLRYSAAHRGEKRNSKTVNPYAGQQVAQHTKVGRQNNSTPVHWSLTGDENSAASRSSSYGVFAIFFTLGFM
jgi:hypothetical protein